MIRVMPHLPTLGENYARNPGAERTPVLTPEWTSYGGATFAADTTDAHTGTTSVRYTTTSSSAQQGAVCQQFRLVGRGTYAVGMWIKAVTGVRLMIGLRLTRGNGSLYAETQRSTYHTTGDWLWVQTTNFSMSASMTQPICFCAQIHTVNSYLPAIGTNLWVDDVRIWQA